MDPIRDDVRRVGAQRRIKDYASAKAEEQRYLRRPRPLPKPHLPIAHWIVLLLVCLAIYNFGFSSRSLRSLIHLRREARELEQRRQELIRERNLLQREREELAGGEAVERYAREQHHYLYEGEELYIIPRTTDGGDEQQ